MRRLLLPALLLPALLTPIAGVSAADADELVPGWPRALDVGAETDSAGHEPRSGSGVAHTDVTLAPSGRLYATWADARHDWNPYDGGWPHEDVELRWSDDGGDTWGPTLNLTDSFARDLDPAVAASPTSALVVHRTLRDMDYLFSPADVVYTRVAGDGTRTVTRLPTTGDYDRHVDNQVVATASGYIHLDADSRATVSVSTDDGVSFGEPVVVLPEAGSSVRHADIASDADAVTVLLRASSNPDSTYDPRVMAVSSSNGGRTWGAPVRVGGGDDLTALTVAAAGERRVASWVRTDAAGLATLEVAVSDDAGVTWSAPTALATAPLPENHARWGAAGTGLVATGDGFVVSQLTDDRPMLHSADGRAWAPTALPGRQEQLVHRAGELFYGDRFYAHVHRSGLVPAGGVPRGRIWPAPEPQLLEPQVPLAARATDDSCPPGEVPGAGFGDVAAESGHRPSIDCLIWWGVARGVSSTAYAPGADVTRAQMATFIANALIQSGDELPEPSRDWFSDDNGNPHEPSINRLAEAGIIAGRGPGVYAPSAPVTRGAMTKFLVQSYEYTSLEILPTSVHYFADTAGTTFDESVNAAASQGLATGYADGYRPQGIVRRDQMASFIARWLDLVVERLWEPAA